MFPSDGWLIMVIICGFWDLLDAGHQVLSHFCSFAFFLSCLSRNPGNVFSDSVYQYKLIIVHCGCSLLWLWGIGSNRQEKEEGEVSGLAIILKRATGDICFFSPLLTLSKLFPNWREDNSSSILFILMQTFLSFSKYTQSNLFNSPESYHHVR